jgi:hypothetical protein
MLDLKFDRQRSQSERINGLYQTFLIQLQGQKFVASIDIKSLKIDCLRFVVCPLLAPAFQG